MRNSTSPLRTLAPSVTSWATMAPATCGLTATVAMGSTLPTALTVTGTVAALAATASTGAGRASRLAFCSEPLHDQTQSKSAA